MYTKEQIKKGKYSDPKLCLYSQDAIKSNDQQTQYRISISYDKGKGIYFYINKYILIPRDGYTTEKYEPYLGVRGRIKDLQRYSDKALLEVANKFTDEDFSNICEAYSKIEGPVAQGPKAQLVYDLAYNVVNK